MVSLSLEFDEASSRTRLRKNVLDAEAVYPILDSWPHKGKLRSSPV